MSGLSFWYDVGMKKLLSLDISSSTIGWSIFEYDQTTSSLISYGHFKPPTKKQAKDVLPYRLEKAAQFLEKLIDAYKPNDVVIEDYAKQFSKGKSQASTIILLATFNELLGWISYKKIGKDVERIPVTTIRSIIGKHFQIKIVSKDDIFPVLVKNCLTYKTQLNKIGNIKKECGDEIDSIACGMTWILKNAGGNLVWHV